jgi:hypothetical protein
MLSGTGTAKADYGPGAQYQIEISANCVGLTDCQPTKGFGIWFWAALYPDGTGDFQAADCAHFGSAGGSGAFHDSGDVTWTSDGDTITINDAYILGDPGSTIQIRVPEAYGHYTKDFANVISITGGPLTGFVPQGWAQVQVAP